ncbi:MAG: hypothetical protein QM784_01250 [Polyangiaceae bacterium]
MSALGKKSGCLGVVVFIAYVVLGWAFTNHSEGLITPDQSVSPFALALGLGTLALRLMLLFVVLPLSVYWAVSALGRRISNKGT